MHCHGKLELNEQTMKTKQLTIGGSTWKSREKGEEGLR